MRMGRDKWVILCFTLILSISTFFASGEDGFSFVISQLNKFQTRGGGFKLKEQDEAPSLEATSHALFLSSLFGLRQKINPHVTTYIHQLENGDFGYGKTAGLASDLESVRHALLSYQHLGQSIPNSGNVAKFVKSLYNEKTHLFANRAGVDGDVKSTALAFQVIDYLGELSRSWVQDIIPEIKSYLEKHRTNARFSFPEEKSLSPISGNYYGIVLGSYAGFNFGALDKWASYITGLQGVDGGFAEEGKTATLEGTAHAVSSLHLLQQLSSESFVDRIDADKVFSYVSRIPRDLKSAALAHVTVAVTKNFVKNFDVTVSYEVLRSSGSIDKRIIQGTQLKPVLTVKTLDGVSHAGLDVEVSISFQSSKEILASKLQWKDTEKYTSDDFVDTENQLGAITFAYTIRVYVVGVGDLHFQITDVKHIGYGLTVDSRALLEVTGKEFQEGETVAIGTNFKFALTLYNHTHDNFAAGDFDVIFSVLDSSNVAIHQSKIEGRRNTEPIIFAYALTSSKIPSGDLLFRFDIANANGVHTSETVAYQLSIPMIATQIAFEGVSSGVTHYKIGQTVKVLIEPASFPDLRTKHTYDTHDVLGKQVAAQRHFFMDVRSPSGTLLRVIPGSVSETSASSRYSFSTRIEPHLSSIGVNVLSFYYVTARGARIDLANYDSANEELFEEATLLNYTVDAELHLTNVDGKPSQDDYFYGNVISFKFQVKDVLSGNLITGTTPSLANFFLSLEHKDENRAKPFTSAHEAAKQKVDDSVFNIEWAINPNAVQGSGSLMVTAQDADGNHLDLYKAEGSKEPFRYEVNIGGKIDVKETTYSQTTTSGQQTAFVVEFSLSCQNKGLKEAQLRTSVLLENGASPLVTALPVATNDETGTYSLSWVLPHDKAPSGKYVLQFYREVDRKRALENREYKDKQRRREEDLKRLSQGQGSNTTETSEQAPKEIESEISPLFTITLYHDAPSLGKLPLRTEVLVLLVLGAAFFAISYQKKNYFTTVHA